MPTQCASDVALFSLRLTFLFSCVCYTVSTTTVPLPTVPTPTTPTTASTCASTVTRTPPTATAPRSVSRCLSSTARERPTLLTSRRVCARSTTWSAFFSRGVYFLFGNNVWINYVQLCLHFAGHLVFWLIKPLLPHHQPRIPPPRHQPDRELPGLRNHRQRSECPVANVKPPHV